MHRTQLLANLWSKAQQLHASSPKISARPTIGNTFRNYSSSPKAIGESDSYEMGRKNGAAQGYSDARSTPHYVPRLKNPARCEAGITNPADESLYDMGYDVGYVRGHEKGRNDKPNPFFVCVGLTAITLFAVSLGSSSHDKYRHFQAAKMFKQVKKIFGDEGG